MATRVEHRILVGICSCNREPNKALRQAIRETWLRRLPTNVMAVFFVGQGCPEPAGDVLQFAVDDSYETLSLKVHAFFKHALESFSFNYLFKCDDDTYLVPERLAQLAGKGDYIGSSHLASKGVASGGAGYLISKRAVQCLANAAPITTWMEDVWVSDVLKAHGTKLLPTPLLQFNFRRLPRPETEFITAHWCSPALMRAIDEPFSTNNHTAMVAVVQATHRNWSGKLLLQIDGCFYGGPARPNGWWAYSPAKQELSLRWLHWPLEVLQLVGNGFQNADLRLEFGEGHSADFDLHVPDNSVLIEEESASLWSSIETEVRRHLPSWQADDDCGVLTAADAAYFPGFQLLLASLQGRTKIALIDAGLTSQQRDWCQGKGVRLIEPQLIMPRRVSMWPAWNKPVFMRQSPFQTSLWIDSDCIVIRSLRPLFEQAKRSLFFVRHWSGSNYPRRNAPELFVRFPVARPLPADKTVNSGVIGYTLPRDVEFLKSMEPLLRVVADDPAVRRLVTWQDEGLFHWALAATGRGETVVAKAGWNRRAQVAEDRPVEFLGNMAANARADDVILHFTGRKKAWHNWPITEQMLQLERIFPHSKP